MNTATHPDRITTSISRKRAAEIRECLDAIGNGQITEWAAQHSEYAGQAPYPTTVGVMVYWLECILRDAEDDE